MINAVHAMSSTASSLAVPAGQEDPKNDNRYPTPFGSRQQVAWGTLPAAQFVCVIPS